MKIGEIAKQSGVSVDTVRFYERVGVLPEPARRPSGYREYEHDTVERIRLTRELQAIGLSLDEVVQHWLPTTPAARRVSPSAGGSMWSVDRVDVKLAELTALRQRIDQAQEACASGHCLFGSIDRSSANAPTNRRALKVAWPRCR